MTVVLSKAHGQLHLSTSEDPCPRILRSDVM